MTIGLFVPCYMSVLRRGDAMAARKVLEALGDDVEVIEGRCCGQPAFNSGFWDEAKMAGREALRAAGEHERIVVPSGSCTTMVRHYLPGLFDDEHREGAERHAERFVEFAEYVAGHPRTGELRFRLDGVVAYHDSCHGRRELGLTATVKGLLARVEGLDVRTLRNEDECCGFGGTFSVKQPEVSGLMGESKLRDVQLTGARVVVSGDLSCLGHLESVAAGKGVRMEAWTVAELLARALK